MTPAKAPARLHLEALLARVRRRVSVRAFAAAWIAVSSTLLASYAAIGTVIGLVGRPQGVVAPADRILVALGILVVSALTALAWTRRQAPDDAKAARFLDRRFRLDDMAATVVSLPADDERSSSVGRALLEEFAERLRSVDVREALPLRMPRWFLVLPAALVLNGIAAVLPAAPRPAEPMVAAEDRPADFQEVARQLSLISQALEAESDETTEDMAALGVAFRELGERVSQGRISQEAASEEVAALLEQLARSVRGTDTVLEAALQAASTASRVDATDDLAGNENEPRPFRFGDSNTSDGDDLASGPPAVSKESTFDPSSVFRTLGEVATAIEDRAGDGNASAGDAGAETASSPPATGTSGGGYYTDWDEEMAAEMAARNAALRQRGQGQAAVGGASESDDAPGDAAGSGERPLDEGTDAAEFARQELQAEDVALSAVERVGGRMVTRTTEPVLGEDSVVGLETSFVASLVTVPEFPVRVDSVGIPHRDTIIEYFSPPGASRGAPLAEGTN